MQASIYDLNELGRKKKHIQRPKGLVGNFLNVVSAK